MDINAALAIIHASFKFMSLTVSEPEYFLTEIDSPTFSYVLIVNELWIHLFLRVTTAKKNIL